MQKGKLIVIDGTDGSGKATQVKLLAEYLRSKGHRVKAIDFPCYEENFMGEFIGECLHGKHGDFLAIDPHIVSVLYAADRFESKRTLEKWLKAGYIVLADRYVSANQIHQGGKIPNAKDRAKFLQWLDVLEFGVFGLPKPDCVIYLDVPLTVAKKLLNQDGKKLDLAETDRRYQENSRKSAQWLSRVSSQWKRLVCVNRGQMKMREDIHQEIITLLQGIII